MHSLRYNFRIPFATPIPTSLNRFVVSSLRPAVFAVALIAVCLMTAMPVNAATPLTLQVNTLADVTDSTSTCATGANTTCSLRDAITLANANSGSTIVFTPGLTGTIYMDGVSTQLTISGNMTIQGPDANLLTIDFVKVNEFYVPTGGTLTLSGLTLTSGRPSDIESSGTVTINSCVISGVPGSSDGALFNYSGTMTVANSLIYGNSTSAQNSGAGIDNYSGTLTVVNSTITGNSAGASGGGIYNTGTATILNSTITGNTSVSAGPTYPDGGGGIYNDKGTVTLANSIVAGNTTDTVANYDDCAGCGAQSANNIIGGTPPSLGPLAWNGGPMKTILPLFGSTAIGAGSYVTGEPATDQRGFPRPTSGSIDLGAVQTHYLTVNNLSDMDDGSCTAAACSLRDAVKQANKDGEGDIRFSITGSIFVDSGKPLPNIAVDLNIAGPGASLLTIDGANDSAVGSVLTINQSQLVAVSGVTISHGNVPLLTQTTGGAITNDGQLTLSNSVISENNTSDFAGTIVSNGEWLLVDSSTISENTADSGGAIYNTGGSILIVNNSTLSGNSTSGDGGGIWSAGGAMFVNNSTLSGNVAAEGGGIYFNCSSAGSCLGVTVNNSTISANAASTANAGGIFNHYGFGVVKLTNSIVAGNTTGGTANSGDCPNCGAQSQLNFIGGNPQLSPLQVVANGTKQAVMIPLPGSPVMGAGNWVLSANGPTIFNQDLRTDERGFPRGTASLVTPFDLGAVQTNYTTIQFATQPSDTAVNRYIVPAPAVTVLETNPTNESINGVDGVPVTLTFSGGANDIINVTSLAATTRAGGLATFGGVGINTPGTGYTFAVKSPVLGSATVTSNTFNVEPPAAAPTFSPSTGTYNSAQTVAMSSTTPSATFYYTTDGSTPTVGATKYSGPTTVSSNETIQAITVATGYAQSDVASAIYSFQVATPAFSPAAGTYTSIQTVTISDTTPGSAIYYTTDGSTPTINSNFAHGPITVSSSEEIQAIAVATGYANSTATSASYTINIPKTTAPTFSPAPGTYFSPQTVTISDATAGAVIYYTTDGTTPTTASPKYTAPIQVSSLTTIVLAIAVANGDSPSDPVSGTYYINPPNAATPTFSLTPGTYPSGQAVTISDSTPNATIYYSTDGSQVTAASPKYTGPITVVNSETLQAIAFAPNFSHSDVASASYTIQIGTPTFSPAAGTYSGGQLVTISDTMTGATIYYTTGGSTPTASSTLYTSAGIKVVNTETIKAIAIVAGDLNSAVAAAAYTINPVASPNFTIAVTPATVSVTGGQSGTATVSVTAQNGFASAVSFTCSGLPAGASCSFSPATVTPSGTTAATTTLAVSTSATVAGAHSNSNPLLPGTALAAALCFFGFRKRRNLQMLLLLAASIIGLTLFAGCGGSSLSSTNPNPKSNLPVVSTVTVTGTSGTATTAIQNNSSFSLYVY